MADEEKPAEEPAVDPDGPDEPPRLTPEQIAQFVMDVVDGRVWTSNDCEPNMLGMVFMPLGLGVLSRAKRSYVEKIGLAYEYLAKAGPRSVNGSPIFMSCKFMHIDDWKVALKALQDEIKRREEAKASIARDLGTPP